MVWGNIGSKIFGKPEKEKVSSISKPTAADAAEQNKKCCVAQL